MDWIDKLSILAIAGLTVVTISLWGNHEIGARRHNNPGELTKEKAAYTAQMESDKQIYRQVNADKEKGLYAEAMAELRQVMEKYPDNPLSYVYLAELHLKQGKLADAVQNYRRAVEMEPDYVDERAPLFRGDEIKEVVKEGVNKFQREKKLKPKDKEVLRALKDVYYLQRRLAGGCE